MRQLHRLYAWLLGYFWLSCTRCGRMFGGHEQPLGIYHRADGTSQATCPECPRVYYEVGYSGPIYAER